MVSDVPRIARSRSAECSAASDLEAGVDRAWEAVVLCRCGESQASEGGYPECIRRYQEGRLNGDDDVVRASLGRDAMR